MAVTGPHRSAHRRAARWLLLLSTVLGLAAMHTLGHAGMRMNPESGQVISSATAAGVPVLVNAVAEPCDGDGCHDSGAMAGWSVCLAVLGGLAVAVLFALLQLVRRRRTPVPGRPMAESRTSRSPPIPATGITVRSTAVLRI